MFAILERWEIHTKFAVLKRRIRALKRNAVPVPNVDKLAHASNACVRSASLAIRLSVVGTSTNVWKIHAEQMRSASTRRAVMIANVHRQILEIRLPCAHPLPITATIHYIVRAARETHVPAAIIVRVENAVIYAMASVADRGQPVQWAYAFVRWVTAEIQTIEPAAAICAANVPSIMTAKVRKFASNLAKVFAIASMHAANSSADRMHCACPAIIDRHAFAPKATTAIRMILA